MKRQLLLLVAIALIAILPSCKKQETPSNSNKSQPAAPAGTTTEPTKNQTYTCPMHPEVISGTPGKCPKCDMNLVLKQ